MAIYQAILVGFDGSSDETDHLLKWIKAERVEQVINICEQNGWDWESVGSTELDDDTPVDAEVEVGN